MDSKIEKEIVIKRLKDKGYLLTSQREYILNLIIKNDSHLTIKDICHLVEDPTIGQSTVYRAIKLFLSLDILRKINFGDNDYYELSLENKHNHHHLICSECGKIIEVGFDYLEDLEKKIYEDYGFIVKNHTLRFCGICKECEMKRSADAKTYEK